MARRQLKGKFGICNRYRDGKVKYFKYNVAEFDQSILEARYPDDTFNLFKCKHCKHWHIGKPKEDVEILR